MTHDARSCPYARLQPILKSIDLLVAVRACVRSGVLHDCHDYDLLLALTELDYESRWRAPAGTRSVNCHGQPRPAVKKTGQTGRHPNPGSAWTRASRP